MRVYDLCGLTEEPPVTVTLYRTSKIEKYWKPT